MGSPEFRVGGRIYATLIYATLAHLNQAYGNHPAPAGLPHRTPSTLLPVKSAWGRSGATHIRLAEAEEVTLAAVLQAAWKLGVNQNTKKRACTSLTSLRRAKP